MVLRVIALKAIAVEQVITIGTITIKQTRSTQNEKQKNNSFNWNYCIVIYGICF
jgi:hypothetical protein